MLAQENNKRGRVSKRGGALAAWMSGEVDLDAAVEASERGGLKERKSHRAPCRHKHRKVNTGDTSSGDTDSPFLTEVIDLRNSRVLRRPSFTRAADDGSADAIEAGKSRLAPPSRESCGAIQRRFSKKKTKMRPIENMQPKNTQDTPRRMYIDIPPVQVPPPRLVIKPEFGSWERKTTLHGPDITHSFENRLNHYYDLPKMSPTPAIMATPTPSPVLKQYDAASPIFQLELDADDALIPPIDTKMSEGKTLPRAPSTPYPTSRDGQTVNTTPSHRCHYPEHKVILGLLKRSIVKEPHPLGPEE